jgi:hypothetical protein
MIGCDVSLMALENWRRSEKRTIKKGDKREKKNEVGEGRK